MLRIVKIPDPVLTTGTKKVEQFDGSLIKLVKDMEQTLKVQVEPQGVGLAAPQVAIDQAIFIIKPKPEAETEAFVNPRILKIQTIDDRKLKMDVEDRKSRIEEHSSNHPQSSNSTLDSQPSTIKKKKKKTKLEGCLSIPKIWGAVDRAQKILLQYQDTTGKEYKKWFSGFKAVIIQHEADHLRGVLFTQRALEQDQQLFEEKEGELKKISSI